MNFYRYVGAPYDSSGHFKDDKRLKMPNLFKNSRNKFKKRFKNSLSRQQNTMGKCPRNGSFKYNVLRKFKMARISRDLIWSV